MGVNHVDRFARNDIIQKRLEDTSTVGVRYTGLTPLFATNTNELLWQIKREVYLDTGIFEVLYADSGKYNNSWDNRASYFPALPSGLSPIPDGSLNDSISGAIANAQIAVTGATELKVGASRLVGRKVLMFQPLNGVVWVGKDNTVTSGNGQKYYANQVAYLPLSSEVGLWAIADSGTVNVSVMEMS